MKSLKPLLLLCMTLMSPLGFATYHVDSHPNLRPPSPNAPRDVSQPLTGNDDYTQMGNTSNMHTITTQTVGTSGDFNPQSRPIPLDNINHDPLVHEDTDEDG